MAKSNRASDFDAEKFLENLNKERQEEIKKRSIIPEGAIDGHPWDNPPPPNMHFDGNLWKWVPDVQRTKEKELEWNPDEVPDIRRPGYSITGKKLLESEELTNQPDNRSPDQSSKSDSGQVTVMSEMDNPSDQRKPESDESPSKTSSVSESSEPAQPEHQYTDTTVTPVAGAKSKPNAAPMPKATVRPKHKPEGTSENPASVTSEDETASNKSEPSAEKIADLNVEQSPKTRVSFKMVNAGFDELAREYLHIVSLGEKKPVFLPLELRNALETLARLSGVPNLAPSHIVINVLKAFFDEHCDLINRKLSGMKLSI